MAHDDALYDGRLVGLLELVWWDGFLSPGGPDDVDRVLDGLDLTERSVLDIGCGVGGVDVHPVQRHGAGYVSGIDVEDNLLG